MIIFSFCVNIFMYMCIYIHIYTYISIHVCVWGYIYTAIFCGIIQFLETTCLAFSFQTISQCPEMSVANPNRGNYYINFLLYLGRQLFSSTRSEPFCLSSCVLQLPLHPDGLSYGLLHHTCSGPLLLALLFLKSASRKISDNFLKGN